MEIRYKIKVIPDINPSFEVNSHISYEVNSHIPTFYKVNLLISHEVNSHIPTYYKPII
jgi:hypothetical protein